MRNLTLVLYLLVKAAFCFCQDGAHIQAASVRNEGSLNLPQMRIGRDDLLSIEVYDSPELSGTVRVDADGTLRLPMLQGRGSVAAAGLLPEQIASMIADDLRKAQFLVNPIVRVTVEEYQSRTVTVVGAVRHPISFQAYGQVTLLDAITRAEGLTDTAGDEVIISTSRNTGGLSKRVKISALMADSGAKNFLLEGGEEVRVPEEGKVSVLGNVKRPGVFPVKNEEQSSLLTLLAQSEGLTPNATADAYIYRTSGTNQPRHEIRVELRRIMDRKEPDMHLEPGDILYVPDNRNRRITLSVLEHLSTLGGASASAFVYAGVR